MELRPRPRSPVCVRQAADILVAVSPSPAVQPATAPAAPAHRHQVRHFPLPTTSDTATCRQAGTAHDRRAGSGAPCGLTPAEPERQEEEAGQAADRRTGKGAEEEEAAGAGGATAARAGGDRGAGRPRAGAGPELRAGPAARAGAAAQQPAAAQVLPRRQSVSPLRHGRQGGAACPVLQR